MSEPLTDPREIRKLLNDAAYSWAYRRNFSLRGPTLDAAIDTAMGAAPALGAA